jgi:molecular chaperone HtpG
MQVIDSLTAGMYNNPLMVLREYVQNAADAIDEAILNHLLRPEDGRVCVTLDGRARTLEVEDNGVGVRADKVDAVLCGVGHSSKRPAERRGFRGIGRLGGVGYCDLVRFETRSSANEPVTVVEWDCRRLRRLLAEGLSTPAEDALDEAVTREVRRALPDDKEHFFRVTMENVHAFHADALMSVRAASSYLSRVAPVPFDGSEFPFADAVNEHLSQVDGYAAYPVFVNGARIYRPHKAAFLVSANQGDSIQALEFFDVHGRGGIGIGRGWYARTSFRSSIPRAVGMRGVRVYQGNVEVGDEHYLRDFFSESRFATWHIGQIHLGLAVKPNARRDGFEQSPDHEAFLEQARLLGRHLSQLCRRSSSDRSAEFRARALVSRIEALASCSIFVNDEHLRRTRADLEEIASQLQAMASNGRLPDELTQRLDAALSADNCSKDAPRLADALDGRKLRGLGRKDLILRIAAALGDSDQDDAPCHQRLVDALRPYMKHGCAEARSTASPSKG